MLSAPPAPLLAHINQASRIVIFSHLGPDGDALGSALGLMWLLRDQGKHADVSFADPAPLVLRFLPGIEEVADRSADGYDLVIAVDGSDENRYGEAFTAARQRGLPVLCIDHHKTNTQFADVSWVDSRYAATAQMIYVLARQAGWPQSRNSATCLATGLVTDTNAFSTDHTSPEVFESVAALMREGAPLATILHDAVQRHTATNAMLWGRVLSTLQIEAGVAWAASRLADRAAVGASDDDGVGIATFLRNIIGVEVGVLFVEEQPQRVRLSMRSTKGHDVSGVAYALGGGGHAQAAGATLPCSLGEALATVLPMVQAVVAGQRDGQRSQG